MNVVFITRCEKVIKCSTSLAFYRSSLTRLIKSLKDEHSCKILYIFLLNRYWYHSNHSQHNCGQIFPETTGAGRDDYVVGDGNRGSPTVVSDRRLYKVSRFYSKMEICFCDHPASAHPLSKICQLLMHWVEFHRNDHWMVLCRSCSKISIPCRVLVAMATKRKIF